MLTILLTGEFDIVWSAYMRQPKLGGGFIYSKLFKYASNVHENYERLASFTIFFGYQMGWPKTTWLLFCVFLVCGKFPFSGHTCQIHISKGVAENPEPKQPGRPCGEFGQPLDQPSNLHVKGGFGKGNPCREKIGDRSSARSEFFWGFSLDPPLDNYLEDDVGFSNLLRKLFWGGWYSTILERQGL